MTSKNTIEEMLEAAYDDDVEKVKALIIEGVDPTSIGEYGDSLLTMAAYAESFDIVKLAVESGVNIDHVEPNRGFTAIMWSVLRDDQKSFRYLLSKKARIDIIGGDGEKILPLAAQNAGSGIIYMLLNKLLPLAKNTMIGVESAFLTAVNIGRTEIATILAEHVEDFVLEAGLLAASDYGYTKIVEMILGTDKCNVNTKDGYDRTSLIIAADRGYLDIVRLLLKEDEIDIHLEDSKGNNALIEAARRGRTAIVKELLAHPDFVYTENNYGQAPDAIAKRAGHQEIVKLINTKLGR